MIQPKADAEFAPSDPPRLFLLNDAAKTSPAEHELRELGARVEVNKRLTFDRLAPESVEIGTSAQAATEERARIA